jgi:hypothetical protein
MHTSLLLAEGDANTLTTALLPGYLAARDALDVEAVAELGGRIVSVFGRMRGARESLDDLRAKTPRRSERGTSAEQDLEDARLQISVDEKGASVDQKVDRASLRTMVDMVPHEVRGVAIAGVAPNPNMQAPAEELQNRIAGDLERTVEMVALTLDIKGHFATKKGLDREKLDADRARLMRWASRPIDLAFLKASLGQYWELLDATAGALGKPSDALDAAAKQAQHTGWFADTGAFEISDAEMWIRQGGKENAEIVLRKLYTADPETRARLLEQMDAKQILDPFLREFGWRPIKELHDSLASGFGPIKHRLQAYFLGGKDKFGPSLGEEWETHETSMHHYLGEVPGVGGALNFVADLATFGVNSSYGKARDAYTSGETSPDAYRTQKIHIAARTAAVAAVSLLTGGAADKFARGAATSVSTLRAVGAGAFGGSVGATAGLATSDTYNVYVSGEQEQFSSVEQYVKTALVGGAFGGLLGGGLKALSKGSRSYIPEEAVAAEENAALARDASDLVPEQEQAPAEQSHAGGDVHAKAPGHEQPPTLEQIQVMEEAGIGESLKMAKEFVKNPQTTYHHYLTKGGLRQIAETSQFAGGDGTASFGGARSVRAWIGEMAPGANLQGKMPVIEFTTAGGEVPNVRLYQSRPGAYWEVDALRVNIKAIHFPDGATAVPEGGGMFKLTSANGHVSRVSAQELPE